MCRIHPGDSSCCIHLSSSTDESRAFAASVQALVNAATGIERLHIMAVKYHFHDAHELQLHVHFVLANNPYLGGREIQCEVVDDDVVLKGCVRSYYQKQMAQESLRKIAGIRRITNQLAVAQN